MKLQRNRVIHFISGGVLEKSLSVKHLEKFLDVVLIEVSEATREVTETTLLGEPSKEVSEATREVTEATLLGMPSKEVSEATREVTEATLVGVPPKEVSETTREVTEAILPPVPPRKVSEATLQAVPPRIVSEATCQVCFLKYLEERMYWYNNRTLPWPGAECIQQM